MKIEISKHRPPRLVRDELSALLRHRLAPQLPENMIENILENIIENIMVPQSPVKMIMMVSPQSPALNIVFIC